MPISLDIKVQGTSNGLSSLDFNKSPPRVLLTSDSMNFDMDTIRSLKADGYQALYLPYEDRKSFANYILHVADPFQLGERFAIIAYGRAATAALEVCMKPVSKLIALVAYYPESLPKTTTGFPPALKVVVHIAGDQDIGFPEKYRAYGYPNAKLGFAESEAGKLDKVAVSLSWSRTLATLRGGFGIGKDLENIGERHLEAKYISKDADKIVDNMIEEPYVTHFPTMTGGRGKENLRRFYNDFFVNASPPSMKMRLISRTIGTDRIVDEMYVSFTHSQEVPWMLPGIEASNKKVEVAIVSIVAIRGDQIQHEHVYWDQASVLAQIGLLDSSKLPIVGSQPARKLLNDSEPENRLLDI